MAFFNSLEGHSGLLEGLGTFCDLVFCLEFLARIVSAPSKRATGLKMGPGRAWSLVDFA